jgi:hypothetical protein
MGSKFLGGKIMALIQCKECNREVSELASLCPSCGAPVTTSLNQVNYEIASWFKNPQTKKIESVSFAWLWTLLFGPFYFSFKAIWTHAIFSLVLAIVTSGFSIIFYPFFAKKILQTSYNKKGWIALRALNSAEPMFGGSSSNESPKEKFRILFVTLMFVGFLIGLGKLQSPKSEVDSTLNHKTGSDYGVSKSMAERLFSMDWSEANAAGQAYGIEVYRSELNSIVIKTKQTEIQITGATIEIQKLILKECGRKYTMLHILQQANIALDGYPDAEDRYNEVVFALAMLDCPESFR